jgi:hypothetical protein
VGSQDLETISTYGIKNTSYLNPAKPKKILNVLTWFIGYMVNILL